MKDVRGDIIKLRPKPAVTKQCHNGQILCVPMVTTGKPPSLLESHFSLSEPVSEDLTYNTAQGLLQLWKICSKVCLQIYKLGVSRVCFRSQSLLNN